MFSDFFLQAFIYLAAAVVAVPLAKRLGLGSALGYLLAGLIIGPYALGLVGEEGQDEYVRSDDQSGKQVPQRRTQAQAPGQRHREHGCSKVYESL